MRKTPQARAQLVRKAFCFETDFPDEFHALRSLLKEVLKNDELIEDEDFRYDLGDIVYNYKRTRPWKEIRESAHAFLEHVGSTCRDLETILQSMRTLDPAYTRRAADLLSSVNVFREPGYNIGHVQRDLEFATTVLGAYRLALAFAIFHEPVSQGRSRPPLPYFLPTLLVMDLWERYTKKAVVVPKGAGVRGKKGAKEAAQPSTEFVRLCLRMMDPTITVANVSTSIKNVLNVQKKHKNKPLLALIAAPTTGELKKAWKKMQKQLRQKSSHRQHTNDFSSGTLLRPLEQPPRSKRQSNHSPTG